MKCLIKRTLDSVTVIARYDLVSVWVKPGRVNPVGVWKWSFSKIKKFYQWHEVCFQYILFPLHLNYAFICFSERFWIEFYSNIWCERYFWKQLCFALFLEELKFLVFNFGCIWCILKIFSIFIFVWFCEFKLE